MRNYVLPHTGFTQSEDGTLWVNRLTGESIRDEDIDHHHTRLTAQIAAKRVTNWFSKLTGEDHATQEDS
jgi:hypothetical protein